MMELDRLFETLVEGILALPGVQHCGPYPRRMDSIQVPAVLLDLVELEPGEDPGTEELALIAHWEARLVVACNHENDKAVIRNLVLSLLQWLHRSDWLPAKTGIARIKQATPDGFSPDTPNYEIWLVEWTQEIHIGVSIWDGGGVTPSQVMMGLSPEIGLVHETDYREVWAHGDGA